MFWIIAHQFPYFYSSSSLPGTADNGRCMTKVMNANDHGEPDSDSGLITPPLSPTKTISTAGWASPRTPTSPRKARSCLFFRDIGAERPFPSPPASPTKLGWAPNLAPLHTLDTTEKELVSLDLSSTHRSGSLARKNSHSAPDGNVPFENEHGYGLASEPSLIISPRLSNGRHSSGTSCSDNPVVRSPTSNISTLPPLHTNNSNNGPSNRLNQLPLRHSSSPLRPSQWVARGGMLSPPHTPSRTPDRFISLRRPPNTTRESFELNKPKTRLTADARNMYGIAHGVDPFSRRLQRSVRLNGELQNLREAHSVITGRGILNRRGANPGLRRNSFTLGTRQVSAGAVWNVGGSSAVSDTVVGVSNGRGGMLGSGTNAPLYKSMFLNSSDPEAELEAYERRLALALDVDQTDKVLDHSTPPSTPAHLTHHTVLDAPQLRDDYYCSLLAYSHTTKCLAVGLGNFVHLWSERKGVDTPESLNSLSNSAISNVQHVTSLSFSSTQGGQAILAVGRADGRVSLWSPLDQQPRFDATQPKPVSCVCFRPTTVKRPSLRDGAMVVSTEELLVGDEAGHIYFYSLEWPNETESAVFGWNGAMTLLARLNVHTQQICGLSWSLDGELFASGGNDNTCFLFETKKIFQGALPQSESYLDVRQGPNGENIYTVSPTRGPILAISTGREKHKWELHAAVKAIAFCPWQRGLMAIGGGSNDRCIHFYHTISGACLATIDCAAQVTSLIWSTSRREIAATFGFAQPEHPFRIAVFAWPSCEQIVAIPWYDENRALYAIPYPGGPNAGRDRGEDGVWWGRTVEEGCLVVAASDAAIRFHEVWAEGRRDSGAGLGLLGGSEILENLHGVQRECGDVIR
ncbi:WD40 repeat-like protein [Lojkania enalia]|uniref:WD40 repeat-like protein n=1 Tax=Lojkania enalia TaxID=147567 RepID=A0A9P4JWL2_9PLEO|nr:WD40 repeat-like protein [Didymosphaeria enalia]